MKVLPTDFWSSQFFTIILPQFSDFWSDYYLTVGLSRVLSEVALMVILCSVKGCEGNYLRDYWSIPSAGGFDFPDNLFRDLFLFAISVEDYGTILRSHVSALTVQCGGIVNGEEET